MVNAQTRFDLRYGWFRWMLVLLGIGPRFSHVDVGPDEIVVRMGWGFHSRIPRGAVTRVFRAPNMHWGIGAHGWKGRWLVNGATTGVVGIEISPPARGRVVGVPIKLRLLYVSLVDPDAFIAAAS